MLVLNPLPTWGSRKNGVIVFGRLCLWHHCISSLALLNSSSGGSSNSKEGSISQVFTWDSEVDLFLIISCWRVLSLFPLKLNPRGRKCKPLPQNSDTIKSFVSLPLFLVSLIGLRNMLFLKWKGMGSG